MIDKSWVTRGEGELVIWPISLPSLSPMVDQFWFDGMPMTWEALEFMRANRQADALKEMFDEELHRDVE